MHYLDNAATSWPKPAGVVEAMVAYLTGVGGNPGRSAHRSALDASRMVCSAREVVASLFHMEDPLRVVFGPNVTEALNLVLRGMLHPGDHVVVSGMEHNAVMRPLRALERRGVALTVVPCSPAGLLDPADVVASLTPATALVVLNHASNVVGTIQPVGDVGRALRGHGIPLLVDAAQTAGAVPIDMMAMGIDLLAFTGHKALLGPMGTGGLVLAPGFDASCIEPLVRGGTGSRSEEEEQPDFLPDAFESGTTNVPGLAGLRAAVDWILARGVPSIQAQEAALTARLLDGLREVRGITVYGTGQAASQTATVSLNIDGMDPAEVGRRLDEEKGMLCRAGLHCAPAAHRTIGTFPRGTVRLSLSAMSDSEDVDAAVAAIHALAQEAR